MGSIDGYVFTTHTYLKNIREYYISQIVTKNSAMAILPSDLFFKYCILCIDMNIVPLVATWIKRCNEAQTHTKIITHDHRGCSTQRL